MSEDFITKMAEYVADLNKTSDIWFYINKDLDRAFFYMTKLNAARDICERFGCVPEVWKEAKKIYDFNKSGVEGLILKDGVIIKED